MRITSPAFTDQESIPATYTCDGENVNPPLEFHEIPSDAETLVMLMDDPDVPTSLKPDGMWDHWVVYNIDPAITGFAENATPPGDIGKNSGGTLDYYGSCPPDREHRYFFKLFALDTKLEFENPNEVTKQMVIDAMQGHIIEQAELIGLYNRPQNLNK